MAEIQIVTSSGSTKIEEMYISPELLDCIKATILPLWVDDKDEREIRYREILKRAEIGELVKVVI